MADLDATAFNDALKEYVDESFLTDIIKLTCPMMEWLMTGKFIGREIPLPMVTNAGQASMSGDFATANTNRAPGGYDKFLLTRIGEIFAIGSINRNVIDQAVTPEGAFDDVTVEIKARLEFVARELAHTLYRTENAVCGVIESISEGGGLTTIVVDDFSDIINLGEGARLVASATAAGALRDSGTVYPVASIDLTTGTLVLTGTAETTSSWAVGDSLHRAGSAPAGAIPKYMSGFDDWVTRAAPSATPFRGVVRSVNPDKLAGLRVNALTSQVREAASELGARIFSNGGRPGVFFCNPLRHHLLEQELDSLASFEKTPSTDKTATIGFNGLVIAVGGQKVRVVADPFCPYKVGRMMTRSSWKFYELGGKKQPRLRDMHGSQLLQLQDADAAKFQAEAKGDLGCTKPGDNGVVVFDD